MTGDLGPYRPGGDTPECGIYTGDARALAQALPDASVDLVFTDPVYDHLDDYRWLAEMAARVLKPRKSVLAFAGNPHVILAGSAMLASGLTPGPVLHHEHLSHGALARLFSHSLQVNSTACLWFSKGRPDNRWMYVASRSYLDGAKKGHAWGKHWQFIAYRLEKFTAPGDVVFDPFCGGGVAPAVCRQRGRRCLAFEIDPETAERARERVRSAQPPLPLVIAEQAELPL